MSVQLSDVHIPSSKLEQSFAVKKIDDSKFAGIKPLAKPSLNSRGIYGGNLCGQSIIAALETVPQGFTPHSLHSYFVKAGDDSKVCDYAVEKISDGKNFANRQVRVIQDSQIKYIVMISFTLKNSIEKSHKNYERAQDKSKINAPIEFQKTIPKDFYKFKLDELPVNVNDHTKTLHHKLPPSFTDHKLNSDEANKSAGDRDLSFWVKVDDNKLKANSEKFNKFKYAGFGVISDSLYLTSLSRILHLPIKNESGVGSSGGKGEHFFSVSLDHSIYFHDDNFDPTNWIFFNFKAPRFSNNRVLLQGDYYDQSGKLFASIVQEGLVFFHSGNELKAKL